VGKHSFKAIQEGFNISHGDWKGLHNIMPMIKSRRVKCGTYWREVCTQGFGDETSGEREMGMPTHKWEDIIKMHL
jgi:hypothetical protein